MIDNEKETHGLVDALNKQVPLRAYATPPLVESLRGQGLDIKVNDAVKVDSALYLGDQGGVACSIGLHDGKDVLVVSITHLRIDSSHPLAGRIQAYQSRRAQRLAGSVSSSPRGSRAGLATKPKRQKTRVVPKGLAKKNRLRQLQQACQLWLAGEYQRAADLFRELIKLEPGDPCCARYWLASCLFQLGSFDELDKLLHERDDDSGVWRFAQALAAFRRHGDSEDAQRLLAEADHLEPGFEDYLLGDKVVDARRQVRFDAGNAERAFGCARLFLPAWRAVPGAATWARRVLKVPSTQEEVSRRFPRADLRDLPLRQETWQVGLVPCPSEPEDKPEDKPEAEPLWMFGVANLDGQEFRALTVIDEALTETVVWNLMIDAFLAPMEGEGARPATLVVCRPEFAEAWKPLLSEIGVRCEYQDEPQPVAQMLSVMGLEMQKRALPPAADVDIREFPQSDAVWQADFIRSPAWVMDEQQGPYRPWSVLVVDKSRSAALATSHAPGEPTPEMLLEFLVRTMARPGGEEPERPRLIEVSDSDCYDHLRPRLEAAGIACRLVDELSELNDFCLDLAKTFDGPEKCALAEGHGVTRAHMESFYEAAQYYFKKAPWRRVPGEVPIEIRCNDPGMGTRFGIVLGRTGVQLGLCIYDNWEITQAMLCGFAGPDENRALAVCYDEAQIMSGVDLQLIDRLGWPIAAPEGWPAAMRIEPQRQLRSPDAAELVFLDACLRALPDFIEGKTTSCSRLVETGTRKVELQLAWKR